MNAAYRIMGEAELMKRIKGFHLPALLFAIVSVFLLPAMAVGETSGEAEVGFAYVSKDSFKFGDFTGMKKEGFYFLGDIDLRYRDDQGKFWTLRGIDLGLDSRFLLFEAGKQGAYGVFLYYDQIPKLVTDSAKTPFDGAGGTVLTLPPGWVAGTTTAGMTNLAASLKDVDMDYERRKFGAGFSVIPLKDWELKVTFLREFKEGTKPVGAVIGNSGGNPRAVLIPEPIDYVTDQVEAVLERTWTNAQVQVGYYLSSFENKADSLAWQNPFAAITGWAAAAGYPTGYGSMALPPDNKFHQFTLSGGYSLPANTRIAANVSFGRMTQDDPFLPYTVNPTLAVTTPLPRGSLDGRIDTTLVNLRVSSRPLPKLNLNANYRFYELDNQTPHAQYIYIGGDSQNQLGVASDRARTNHPYSFKQNQLQLDAGYEVYKRTYLTAGYEHNEIERTLQEAEKTKENTYKAKLRSTPSDVVSGSLTYAHSDRKASEYHFAEPFLTGYSPEYLATIPAAVRWENNPLLRKFYLADRDRDKLGSVVTITPHETLIIGLSANFIQDDYDRSEMGLTDSKGYAYTVDVSYTPKDHLTTYAFYTNEKIRSNQDGRQFSGGAVKEAQANDPTRDWFAKHRDKIDTVGVGANMTVIKNKLDAGAGYVYSRSKGIVDVTTGTALTAAPLPDLVTTLHGFSVYAKYHLRKNLSLKLGYLFEKFSSTDWGFDYVSPNALANVITLGQESPDYNVHVVTARLVYRFW